MIEEIIKIVKDAGQIILQAHNIESGIENKAGRANFVTKYDVEVQNYLYKRLSALLPGAYFIGEEDEKREASDSEYCFIIDPIDGTTNFIFDYKHSAISVALLHNKKTIAGVVYNPYLKELFSSEAGKGAYLNDLPLKVNNLSIRDGIVGFGTSPYYPEKEEETFTTIRKLFHQALDIRRTGSAALDICYVAANRFVLYYESVLAPWDHAAASLILQESGGIITTLAQTSLSYHDNCSVIAATPTAYNEFFVPM